MTIDRIMISKHLLGRIGGWLSLTVLFTVVGCTVQNTGIQGNESRRNLIPSNWKSSQVEGSRLYNAKDQCSCNPSEYEMLDEMYELDIKETLLYHNLITIRDYYHNARNLKNPSINNSLQRQKEYQNYSIRSFFVQEGFYHTELIDATSEATERNGGLPEVFWTGLNEWMLPRDVWENREFRRILDRNRDLALSTIAVVETDAEWDVWLIPHEAPDLFKIFTSAKDESAPKGQGTKDDFARLSTEDLLSICSRIEKHEKQVLAPEPEWGAYCFDEFHLLTDEQDVSHHASRDRFIKMNYEDVKKNLPCLYISATTQSTLSSRHIPHLRWVGASYHYLWSMKDNRIVVLTRYK